MNGARPSKWTTDDPEDFSYEVMGAWAALSPFRDECDIAVHRYRQLRDRGVRGDIAYYAFATWAAQERDEQHPSAPYHAIGFTEGVARAWCARIGEIMREIEKADERDGAPRIVRGLRPIGHALGEATRRIVASHSEGGR